MSIGLAARLAPQDLRRALVRAQHTLAFSVLAISFLSVLVFQQARPGDPLWPAALVLVPSMALLQLARGRTSALWCVAYLAVSAAAVFLHALILLSQPIPVSESDGFSFLAAKLALIMVGGSLTGIGSGVGAGMLWTLAGYGVAELAVILAQVTLGHTTRLDVPALIALAATLLVIPLVGMRSRRYARAQPILDRAAEGEQVADLRYRIESKAAALMHDTVLNHLAAIADSPGQRLEPALRSAIQRDLNSLTAEAWLLDSTEGASAEARIEWQHSGVFTAVQESRILGLDVRITGDLSALARLERGPSLALGLAVKQCLVNVLKHSGTNRAELAVYGTDEFVSVMVVDDGRGFVENATGRDRLGLKSSVRARMELVGGEVTIWSSPGHGTSVMITVPAADRVGERAGDA